MKHPHTEHITVIPVVSIVCWSAS